jgi:DNA-binding transcriptional MerR regulator
MDSISKKYYKIREVSDLLHIPATTLRFWESRFKIIKPRRNEHGTRFYTPSDIEVIRMINYYVKEKGLKLEAAQELISKNRDGVSRRYEAIERLRGIRATLVGLLDSLNSRSRVPK